jgi:beta-galactosidase
MRQRLVIFLGITFLLLNILMNGVAQNQQLSSLSHRMKDSFDFNWQFHKGDIAIKRVVRVGQGGITDINVPVITKKDTIIDYTNFESSKVLNPTDWKEVNLPHDWCVEGTFVHDNTLGSQPAGSGYLPVGIGFYRKEFEISETDKGKKYPLSLTGFSEIALFGSMDIFWETIKADTLHRTTT